MIFLRLYLSFLKIGFSSFGGMTMIPIINDEVLRYGWMTSAQVMDIVAIAEMTPGPIAVNSATFVGIRIGGIPGAVVATAGCILPSLIIVSLLAFVYYRYRQLSLLQSVMGSLRPAVTALIGAAGLSILMLVAFGGAGVDPSKIQWLECGIFLVAFLVLRLRKKNPILVMVCCGAAELVASVGLDLLF